MIAIYLFVHKYWKHLCVLTAFPMVIYCLYAIFELIHLYLVRLDKQYPQPALGITINSWLDEFLLELGMIFVVNSPILLICLIVFIISFVNLRKVKETN